MVSKVKKSPVVLVHGAFRGGWTWQRVRRILQKQQVEVFTPSLLGAGEKSHLISEKISLSDWVNDISNLLIYEDLQNVVLVGHSQGGIVIQGVAENISERISQMIFIDSPVLRNGECALDAVPEKVRETFGRIKKNELIQPIPITPNKYLSETETAWFNERLTPVPTNPSFEKIAVVESAKIPQKFVFCSETPPFFPSNFTRQRFDREGCKYALIDAPHDCIWTHPRQIAEICLAD